MALTCLGGYLSAGGAGAVNHWFDRDIDALHGAHRHAADPRRAHLAPRAALLFGCTLAALSFLELSLTVNVLAASLSFAGFLGYVFVYTVWLKRRTPQNIVIGGAAGAVPPLVGWAAVTGSVSGTAVILFFIVFFWTPPHFWALSPADEGRVREGRRADAAGRARREPRRAGRSCSTRCCSTRSRSCRSAPAASARIYLVASMLLGLRLHRAARSGSTAGPTGAAALQLYLFSLAYLALLFCAMVADAHL